MLPLLQPGDLIRVTHPAGRTDRALLQRGIERLRARGFRVEHDPALGDRRDYLAADDADRAADLRHALTAPGIRAVLAARGGYGTQRILPAVHDAIRTAALACDRWIIGYSDITALHLALTALDAPSVHGPLAMGLGRDHPHATTELDALLTLLTRGTPPQLTPLTPLNAPPTSPLHGPLAGGNLSLLAALAPTPNFPSLRGKLLFLEEIAEPPYRIDRMLSTLRLAGTLDGVQAILLGHFTRCGPSQNDAHRHIAQLLADLPIPVLATLPAGHDHPNLPLLLGHPHTLTPDGQLLPDPLPLAPAPDPATARKDGRPPAPPTSPSTSQDSGQPAPPTSRSTAQDSGRAAPAPFLLPRPSRTGGVLALLHEALADGVCSAAQLVVRQHGRTRMAIAAGTTARTTDAALAPVTPDTRFDLASLTKALCTAPLAALARETLGLSLDDRIPTHLCVSQPTLRDLLRHTSGLPAHVPVFEDVRRAHPHDPQARQRAAELAFAAIEADESQRGTPCYSDVGFIALGRWLAELFGAPLDAAMRQHFTAPLGLHGVLGFRPGHGSSTRDGGAAEASFAATEWCPWRARTLQGVVHDENAQVLGGAAGHAGLFGTAEAVADLMAVFSGDAPGPLSDLAIADMWDLRHRVGTHVLGWDTMSMPVSSAGTRMSAPHTVGHLGFTGTSVWLDRSRGLLVVLLTNRVHPSRDDNRIRDLRPALHDAVVDAGLDAVG